MLLSLQNVRSYYGKSQVLQGMTFGVAPGEVTCLLGRNGVGKTTTLKSILGLVPPREGSIKFEGEELFGLPTHRIVRRGIGFVPEERRIFPTLSVRENLLMGSQPAANGGKREWDMDRVFDYFPQLKQRENSLGRFLSGGEQQMLSIARALVSNPRMLLIDEPAEGLAPVIVQRVVEVIRDIAAEGITVLLVESKLAIAEQLANHVHVISKGQIVFSGTSKELSKRRDVREQFLEV
ncbi:MAG: ABC transporter ATP-binding protein [Hyphomicrobiales bacterium]